MPYAASTWTVLHASYLREFKEVAQTIDEAGIAEGIVKSKKIFIRDMSGSSV
jgi:hypothetical protein